MTPQQLMQWMSFIQLAASLGVKSWNIIRATMTNAGLDDAQIALLQPKWDALEDDVRRAAEGR